MSAVPTITPEELRAKLSSGVVLIDVRTPAEFGEAHVEGARNVPLDRLDPSKFLNQPGTLHVICQRGGRAKQACEKLLSAGVLDLVNVEGGTSACESGGLPLVRGAKAISLERQVRIAAGSLVVLSVLLGVLVHPAWLGLAGFVGAGLVFAGVTDTCGMGMLLARMPWNQRATSCTR
ncbi:rhodanese-like domain-containing protein [Botrimarina hoheduenensis]|uniref:Inner membrane protein YgaP n=1 Tax=Botrimarina hoheduenensis TaxID=2528000 RepID=A0A5C5VVX0_9BACT|nr:rhodanese-like domain-containing protein [Botrimarina hoheduenensis]TWT42734.1 Inner membrane protein YgaP [Botrimarina hoheduenensis]